MSASDHRGCRVAGAPTNNENRALFFDGSLGADLDNILGKNHFFVCVRIRHTDE
jgi:hypothetical protein